jgi:hypothetical protein
MSENQSRGRGAPWRILSSRSGSAIAAAGCGGVSVIVLVETNRAHFLLDAIKTFRSVKQTVVCDNLNAYAFLSNSFSLSANLRPITMW